MPLAAESGSEYRLRIGRRLGQQPREQQRRPIQRRVLRGVRKHVDERRRRREGGGGWDRGRERLEGVEGGGLRGAAAQSLGHGIRAEVHVCWRALVRPAEAHARLPTAPVGRVAATYGCQAAVCLNSE